MQKKISNWFQNANNKDKGHKSNNNQEKIHSKKEDYDLKLAIEASLALAEEEKQLQKDIKKVISLNNSNSSKKINNEDNSTSNNYLDSLSNDNILHSATKHMKTIPNSKKQMNKIEVNNKLIPPIPPKIEAEFNWSDVEAFVKDVTTFGVKEKTIQKSEKASQYSKKIVQDHCEYISTNRSSIDLGNLINQSAHTNNLTKGNWHDEDAEKLFFGQFNKETWNKNDITKAHKEYKKRSMSSVIKDSNKRLKSNRVTQERSYNYYSTSDEVLEDTFEESGFGSSLTSLSYEGVGQSRYT
ncbi:unnamed protein product [Cunninghamella blakesleeana]